MSALPFADASPINGIVPSVIVLLCWLPYHARARTLSRQHRAVPVWRQACFAGGLITLAIALSAPVDSLADQLLVAHMAEHHQGMEVPGIYWHFVDAMWIVVYTAVYVL